MEERYKKQEKLFGTDGIRGIPGEYPLTDGMIFKIGYSIARLLHYKWHNFNKKKFKIAIARDTRLSSPKIETILVDTLTSYGVDVVLCNIVPTPALAYIVKKLSLDMGIMISASHNRSCENGIKFFNERGEKLSSQDEEWIEEIIFNNLVHVFYDRMPYKRSEMFYLEEAREIYSRFLISILADLRLTGIRVCLDCGWGATSQIAKNVFERLEAEVFSFADSFSGEKINETGALNPSLLRNLVLEKRADMGFAFDGDGDRVILVDEKGKVLDGDYILAIVGRYLLEEGRLSKKTVVATQMSNYGLKEYLEKIGCRVIFTPVGDRYVWQALERNNLNLGGEQSGHIILRDFTSSPDALVCALFIAKIIKERKKPLSELVQEMRKFPQVLVNIKVKEKIPFELMPPLKESIKKAERLLGEDGRLLIRYSGTEPLVRVMVEGKDERLIQRIAQTLAEIVEEKLG
ncbi:MAG: phosphoglucosamine mutase [Candidatus Omnitrophica bacterium 4484_70.1]|nr:MAG: phosphoglucosamine mutase [Candidatus Omnitrophica bacterium 4484_70.1]